MPRGKGFAFIQNLFLNARCWRFLRDILRLAILYQLLLSNIDNVHTVVIFQILLLANKPRIVPWRTERMLKLIQRHSWVTLNRSAHPKWEQDQTEKSSYGLPWLQKGIWYGSAELDNKLLQNIQNFTWSNKLNRENYENLESWIDSRRKKLSWNKDPKRNFSRRCSITRTIYNCHDAT